MTGRVIAVIFALSSFAASVVYGLARDAALDDLIVGSLVVLMICYGVGLAVGHVAQRCVEDHVTGYRLQRPIPEDPTLLGDGDASSGEGDPEPSLPAGTA